MSDQQGEVVNLDTVQNAGRPYLKNGEYSIRCIACEKGKSRKGNEMLTMQWEIVSPAEVTIENPEGVSSVVKIAGLKLTDWVVLNDLGFPKLKALHKNLQLDMKFNMKNPNVKQYVGKAVKAALTTDPQVLKDDNTGEPMLDENGQPQTINTYKVQRFNRPDMENTIPADSVAF